MRVAQVQNDEAAATDFTATFTLYDDEGEAVGSASTASTSAPPGISTTVRAHIDVQDVKLWNSAAPSMYTVGVAIAKSAGGAAGGAVAVDGVNVTTGFRSLRYDADHGFFLNEEHFKVGG